jgi:DNA-binding CsgD family transcriptional regulator
MGQVQGRLVGRDTELARLGECVDRARSGAPTVVVIEGDAGIGKTRLLTEALAAFRDRKDAVAIGHGLELAGGELPYGTAADSLRALVRDIGVEAVRSAANGYAPALASLCPTLGPSAVETDRSRLLPAYASTLESLATDRLVWLLVEDLHWADTSSRDLISYLVRVVGPSQLVVVLTFRSNDPTVDRAAVDLLTSLASLQHVTRITLTGLGAADVAVMMTSFAGSVPTRESTARMMALTQGNPLLTEQLAASGFANSGPAPDSVLAPMQTRIERLGQGARRLVQVAALDEGHLSHRLLEQAYLVAGLHRGYAHAFETAIQQALGGRILSFDPGTRTYSFTHALMRQAADASMGPTDRMSAHRTWAELLSERPNPTDDPTVRAAVAHHWAEAGDDTHAFNAALAAAEHAETLGAWPEAALQLRRAVDLFHQVPDAELHAGCGRDKLLADTLTFLRLCDSGQEIADLLDAELRTFPASTDWVRQTCLRVARTTRGHLMGEEDAIPGRAEVAIAKKLLAAPTSPLLYQGLTCLGWEIRVIDPDLSFQMHSRSLEVARQVGLRRRELDATQSVCHHLCEQGRFQEALTMIETLRARVCDPSGLMALDTQLGDLLMRQGRFEEAVKVLKQAVSHVQDPLLEPSNRATAALTLAEALTCTGGWRQARTWLADAMSVPPRYLDIEVWAHAAAGELACASGKLELAQRHSDHAHSLITGDLQALYIWPRARIVSLDAAIALGRDDYLTARRCMLTLLESVSVAQFSVVWPALLTAARAEGDRAEASATAPLERDLAAITIVSAVLEALSRSGPLNHARYVQGVTDLNRAMGTDDASEWHAVVDAWRRIGHLPHLGWALYRLAGAAVRDGDRDAAARCLTEAWEIAERLGAGPLKEKVVDLARRLRMPLEPRLAAGVKRPRATGARLARLTDRELEVLRHVAQGATNHELATALFISPKTASVHVHRIMTKLGVTSRTKATAVAYEEGLLTDDT